MYSIREPPLKICTAEEIIDDDHVIISLRGVLEYLVGVASFVDRDLLEPGVSALITTNVPFSLQVDSRAILLLALFKRTQTVRWM